MNGTGNLRQNSANSVPRYELIGKDGRSYGSFKNPRQAALTALSIFPGEEQDEERSGRGWDLAVSPIRK